MDRENPVPAVQILQASKSFTGGVAALRELSLEVQQGERVVIIGPSGSGKSTLLRCLAGLEPVDAGRILIEGVPLNEKTRRKIGMVFQSFNLFPHLTVLDNLNLAQRLVQKKSLAEATAASLELLARVNMPDKARSLPGELSGGQQQRVAIARALALKPRIMLFDEVTSALETRMGKGKGAPEFWVAAVKRGRVLFEFAGIPQDLAEMAFRTASHKLPIKVRMVSREGMGGED